jgi:glycosyltransferase involved in cell wall biosynthesis
MPRLYFITHRISNVFTGGEFCNSVLLKGAVNAGLEVECWGGDRYGWLKKMIVIMNIIYLVKTFFMARKSFLLINMDFHARYVFAMLWARHVKKAKIIGLLYHYSYWEKYSSLSRMVNFIIEQWVSKRCDYLITISNFCINNFRQLSRKDVPTFILEPFSRDKAELPNKIVQFNPACQKLLLVGSIEPRKNIVNVIKALALLKTPFIFDIVGVFPSKTYRDAVTEVIRSLNLENRVFLHGKIDRNELLKKYASATVFILISRMEGYGMVYAEAMGFGLPIVASTCGAVPELVGEDVNGFLCDPDDIIQIAEAINKLRKRETWERISRNNLLKAESFKTRSEFENDSYEIFKKIQSFQTWTSTEGNTSRPQNCSTLS